MSDPEKDLEEYFKKVIAENDFKEFVPTDEFDWNEEDL